jgi:hypothetical protein
MNPSSPLVCYVACAAGQDAEVLVRYSTVPTPLTIPSMHLPVRMYAVHDAGTLKFQEMVLQQDLTQALHAFLCAGHT